MLMERAFSRRRELPFRWRLVLLGGLTLSLVQALLMPRLAMGDFTPDVFTVFALYLGLFASRQGRYMPSLALGLMRDFFSLGLLGSYGVLYSLLHKAAGKARLKLDPDKPANVFIMAVIGTFLVNFGYHVMLALAGDGVGFSRAFTRCAATAIATGPLAVLSFPILHFVLAKLGAQRGNGGYWNI